MIITNNNHMIIKNHYVRNKVYTYQTASSTIVLCEVGGSFCFSNPTFSQKWSIIQQNSNF